VVEFGLYKGSFLTTTASAASRAGQSATQAQVSTAVFWSVCGITPRASQAPLATNFPMAAARGRRSNSAIRCSTTARPSVVDLDPDDADQC